MTKNYVLLTLLICFFSSASYAQLTGTKTIPGDYATISAAVTALNAQGVGAGGVTFNVAAGYTETLASRINMTATGTAANPIIFQKSGSGANPKLTAFVGANTPSSAERDGMFSLTGSDFVTIDGIDLAEAAANVDITTQMEYGYGLFKSSDVDGCKSNTIKNCVVTLDRLDNTTWTGVGHNGSCGIVVLNCTPTANTAIVVVDAAGSNSSNKFYANTVQNCNAGIVFIGYAAASPFSLGDTNNDVGGSNASTGNTILNFGGSAAATNPATGIFANNQWGFNCSRNIINNNNGSGVNHVSTLRGIFLNSSSTSASVDCNFNTITIKGGATTSQISCIENSFGATAAGNTVNINNNTITNCTSPLATTGIFYGIYSTSSCANLNINNNTFSANDRVATSGATYLIYNSGAVTTSINMNNNNLSQAFPSATAYTGTFYGIYNGSGTTATKLSMTGNIFSNFSFTTTGTGAMYYMYNTNSSLRAKFNNNTWNNISVMHSGTEYLIYNSTSTQADTLFVQNNAINGSYTRTAAAGTMYCYYSGASSLPTCTHYYTDNNFSNITASSAGTGTFYGIYSSDGATSPYPKKFVSNNTLNNITYNSTGTMYGIYMSYLGDGSTTGGTEIFNNTISGITFGGTIYGLYLSSIVSPTVKPNVYSNKVFGLTSTSLTASLYGTYLLGGGAGLNFYKNKIYDIVSNNTSTTALTCGTYVSSAVATDYYNNIIGDIKAPTSANPTAAVNGFYANGGTVINLYYNTIYLSGTSSGANFGGNAIYCSTTPNVTLRNNIFDNLITPVGTGVATAYRRSSTTLTTYNSASNNNSFYAGTPGANNLIFTDGTATAQTIGAYKALVAPRDAASVSENVNFLSVTGSSSDYLHINPAIPTQLESNAVNIAGITDDFDAVIRQGNAGYSGTGTAPDIGADEGNFIGLDISGPGISYTQLPGACGTGDLALNGVVITDATGIPLSGSFIPRIYFKKNAGAYFSSAGSLVSGNANNSTWNFNMSAAVMGGLSVGDVVSYYVIAQDIVSPTINISSNPSGVVATDVLTIITHPATPNTVAILPSMSGTYTVGSGGFFATLTEAVTTYNSSCVSGPVVFSLTDASYTAETFPISINQITGQSATNTLTIKPAAGNSATISGTSSSCIIRLNGADYVIIDGSNSGGTDRSLTIINSSTAAATAVVCVTSLGLSLGATNNTIKNCNITAGGNTTTSIFGIYAAASLISTSGSGEDNDNLTIQNNVVTTAYIGIYARAASTAGELNGLVISKNTIGANATASYVTFKGVDVAYADAAQIAENNIFNIKIATSVSNAGIDCGAGVRNSLIARNNITGVYSQSTGGWGAYGINFSSSTGGTTNNLIANNFVSDIQTVNYSSSTTYGAFGIRLVGGTNFTVVHNSVHLYGLVSLGTGTSSISSCFLATTTSVTGTILKNNIFFNEQSFSAGTTSVAYSVYVPSGYVFAQINNNDYFGISNSPTTYNVGFLGSAQPSLNAWKIATGQDAMSINLNPTFTSDTDLHISSNECINQGAMPIAGITVDYDGMSRDANLPDIGADEINGNNVALTFSETSGSAPNDGIVCSGSTVVLNAAGGATYLWSTGATSSSISDNPTTTTTYAVTITLAAGCSRVLSQIITVNPAPTVSISPTPAEICAGGSISLTASGGISYLWSTGETNATINVAPSSTATYTVTVTDAGLCSNIGTKEVVVNPLPIIVIDPTPAAICEGGSIELIASGANTYLWNTGQTSASITVSPTTTTTYSVTATSLQLCSNTASKEVVVNPIPAAAISPSAPAICAGQNQVLTASGGSSYLWSTGETTDAITVSPSSNTMYSVTVTGVGNCTNVATVMVTITPGASITPVVTEPSTCVSFDGAINLVLSGAAGPYTFNWSSPNGGGINQGQQNQSTLSVGTYFVTVTAGNGCTSTASISLLGPGGCSVCPTIGALNSNVSQSCKSENFTLTASGLTDMGTTYGITFKYSASALADPYVGGTILGTVPNTPFMTSAVLTTSIPTTGSYFIYAILNQLPLDPTCRPSQSTNITTYTCTPFISDPCACKNNATTLTNGQFDEVITVNAPVGQIWTVTAVSGLYASNSPAPPAAPTPIAVGTQLFGTGNDYTLSGVHVDALGYSVTVSNGTTTLTIGNTCYYPNPVITGLNNTYCLYDPAVTLTGSAQLGDGSGAAQGVGTFTVNGAPATQFIPSTLGAGTHIVQYCFDAEDGVPNGAHPGCTQCINQTVIVNPTPTVNGVSNQTYCTGALVPSTIFGGTPTGVFFTWTNSNTAIGLGASGTGNLPSFTATNTTTAAIFGTITVTPNFTNGGVTCQGAPITFTITVSPVTNVGAQANRTFCSGIATGGIVFTSTVPGTTFNWTNSNTLIGIGASGVGNIPSWIPVNNTAVNIVGTITVTPVVNTNGVNCSGAPITFTITILPAPKAMCKNFTLNLDASGNGTLNPNDINNGSVGGTLTISKSSFNCGNIGANNVTLTVTDVCGQTNTCVAVVTVVDNVPPIITCPKSIVETLAPGECNKAVAFENPTAKDNCELGFTPAVITTTFASNNQFAGNMFNVTNNTTQPITLTSFEGNVTGAVGLPVSFQIFYTTTATTYVGNETNAAAWTSMGTANTTCAGLNNPTIVPIGGLTIQPGQTKGIYFVLSSYNIATNSLRYTNGNNVYNNGDLTITTGIGKATPNFTGTTFLSRTWNGRIRYNKVTAAAPTISQIDNTGFKSGDVFPKGTTCLVYQARDFAGNLSATCQVCVEIRGITNPTSTLTCNDLSNVSLDTNCLALINADMILEGGPYDCYSDYKVILTLNGKTVPNPITAEYAGKTLTATVVDKFSNNKCWGLLKIEDKVLPQIVCPPAVTISCAVSSDPGNTGAIFPNGLRFGTFEQYSDPTTGVNVYRTGENKYRVKAGLIDKCSEVILTYNDVVQEFSCSANNFIIKIITRKWAATDIYGNSTNCTQTISVRRAVLTELVMPRNWDGQANQNRVLNLCKDLYTGNPNDYRHLDSAWVKLTNGHPSPKAGVNAVDTIYVGEFDPFHDPLNPGTDTLILRGTGMPSGATCNTINMLYTDTRLNVCADGYKLIRDWRILDWCSGQTRNYTQLIKVVDMTAPVLVCPVDLTASTDALECKGSGQFPIPNITDVCSPNGLSYEVTYRGGTAFPDGGYIGQNPDGSWRYSGLSCGTYNFKYTAKDACGNVDSCINFDLIIRDLTVPVPVCRTVTQVTLSNTPDDPNTAAKECGLTRVESFKFNEGSWDNCAPVHFKVRRSNTFNPGVYDNDPRFDDYVWFNCEDVGKEVDVILRVYDVQPLIGHVGSISDRGDTYRPTRTDGCGPLGNFNDCVVKVRVEDLVNPTITCPPQLNITCTAYDFSIPLTNADTSWFNKYFGKVVTADCNGNYTAGSFTYFNGFNQVTGSNGLAFDNCFVTIPQTFNAQLECGVGTITRTFRAVDRGGRQSSPCTQLIVVTNPTPFTINASHYTDPGSDLADPCDGAERIRKEGSNEDFVNDLYVSPNFSPDDIIWPDKVVELTSCTGIGAIGTECANTGKDAGRPRILRNDKCDLVAITFTDEVFPIAPPACVKVLRTWRVIDWCQNKPTGRIWTYTQIIKLVNKVAPEFTGNTCNNDTICQYPTDCGPDPLTLCATATDDCTATDQLKYTFFIDVDNNGTNDLQGSGSCVTLTKAQGLRYGRHMITWAVEDICGNVKTCSKIFLVKDCKKPTPVSKLLTIELMPNNCQATLEAVKVNNFSWDNCTPMANLRFRLAKSGEYKADMTLAEVLALNDYVVFTAGELGTQTIGLFVIDADNNWDYVETFILVQSNMNPDCGGGTGTAAVSGTIQTEAKENVDKVEVKVNGTNKTITDAQGFFNFLLSKNASYTVAPEKLIEPRNGVTTADLVAINKHILAVDPLSTPYRRIAADINNDGKISTADMVELRKLILFINDDFTNNKSWKMVDKSYSFKTTTPEKEAYPLNVTINPLQAAASANFVAVKIGDVNGSAKANSLLGDASERSSGTLNFEANDATLAAGETKTVTLSAKDVANISGYQFTLNFDKTALEVVSVSGLNEGNFGLSLLGEGVITASNDAVAADQAIAITFKAKQATQLSQALSIGSRYTAAEAYTVSGDKYDVALSFKGTTAGSFQLLQNQPNPFNGKTVIGMVFPEATAATMTIFDATGRTLKVIQGDYAKGYNEVTIDQADLKATGILSYRLTTDKYSATKQMIIAE